MATISTEIKVDVLAELSVPFADAAASALVWRLDAALQIPLAAACVHLRGVDGTLELGVLGSSHQAVVRVGDATLCETVACAVGQGAGLPTTAEADHALGAYRFRSTVWRLDEAELRRFVSQVADRLARRADAVVARFPGSLEAVTALEVEQREGGGTAWRTWHAYPQSGEVVETASVVFRR